jgi:hypothetical protein
MLAFAAVVALFCGAWTTFYVQQCTLRSRAESLLAGLQRIEVGASSSADAQSVVASWYQWGAVETVCSASGCSSVIRLKHTLPGLLTGYGNPTANNLLARITDHLGLRNAGVSAGLKYKNGVITGKALSVQVMLPSSGWFTGGAFVPDLVVLSNETAAFTQDELEHVSPTHPYRVVRRIKDLSGLSINFMPKEPADQKQRYMDFHLSCFTRFSPCRQESDILPAASELVNEVF